MNYSILTIGTFATMSLCIAGAQAQNALPATGGNAEGTGGTASYTVGSMVYTEHSSTSGSVALGVQHGYMARVVSSQAGTDDISCIVYPNPVAEYIELGIAGSNLSELQYQLTDLHGKVVEQGRASEGTTRIDLRLLAQSNYYLRVTNDRTELKTFLINKN